MFWIRKTSSLLHGLNLDELRSRTEPAAHPYLDAAAAVISQSPNSQIERWAHLIADASDRAVLNAIPLLSQSDRIVVSHLLSGASLTLENCQKLSTSSPVIPSPPTEENADIPMSEEKLFWWLWRCLPQAICQHLGQEEAILLPASETLPDASLWSHTSLAAAMAGALVGNPQRETAPDDESFPSCPHLAIFSFSPVQELIKASRKMRDFWAGSWILHYLSARVCWKLAQKYGPDCLIYPSLYQQPSIDHWLRQQWPDFAPWVKEPSDRALLTAGFPNVIVALLPQGEVEAAMQTARQTLTSEEWLQNLGGQVYEELKKRRWVERLTRDNPTWNGWLKHQWQIYWTALPLGGQKMEEVICHAIAETEQTSLNDWMERYNHRYHLKGEKALFHADELQFLREVQKERSPLNVNVGSWWPYLFDQLRFALASVKSPRNWRLPTAFIPRSTISGLGAVVYPLPSGYPNRDAQPVQETDVSQYWKPNAGLFDGIEALNATETVNGT